MPRISLTKLGKLKHKIIGDQTILNGIVFHLRDFHKSHSVELICDVVDSLVNFKADRLQETLTLIDDMMLTEETRVRKHDE